MAGGTAPQSRIVINLSIDLGNHLEGKECELFSAVLRIRIAPDGLYTYPDLSAVCGAPLFVEKEQRTLLNPILLIEVLSPSTEGYDRGFKSAQYRQLPSLSEYVVVSQREPRVEIFRRQASGEWVLIESVGLETSCHFASINCTLPLSRIYRTVQFPEVAGFTDRAPG